MEFMKGMTAIVSIRLEEIKKFSEGSIEKIQVLILRNIDSKELENALDTFKMTDQSAQ